MNCEAYAANDAAIVVCNREEEVAGDIEVNESLGAVMR